MTTRIDPQIRQTDYCQALEFWLRQKAVKNIVFCENSGWPSRAFSEIARKHSGTHSLELLDYKDTEGKEKGKGFGECGIIDYALRHSRLISKSRLVMKVTGRLTVSNISKIVSDPRLQHNVDLVSDINRNLRTSDSRLFIASKAFLKKHLIPRRSQLNDAKMMYFEHILAQGALSLIAEGGKWIMPSHLPDFRGISASTGGSYQPSLLRVVKYRVKKWFLEG